MFYFMLSCVPTSTKCLCSWRVLVFCSKLRINQVKVQRWEQCILGLEVDSVSLYSRYNMTECWFDASCDWLTGWVPCGARADGGGCEERRVHPSLSGHESSRLQQEAECVLPEDSRLESLPVPGCVRVNTAHLFVWLVGLVGLVALLSLGLLVLLLFYNHFTNALATWLSPLTAVCLQPSQVKIQSNEPSEWLTSWLQDKQEVLRAFRHHFPWCRVAEM